MPHDVQHERENLQAPGGPLAEFLRVPAAAIGSLVERVTGWLPGDATPLSAGIIAVTVAVGAAVLRGWWRQWTHTRMAADARLVTVSVPPTVEADGAEALWSNLTGLLRPAWRRMMFGQPHVCFEYAFGSDGPRLRVWVPGVVPPGLVEHAIQAAWPGARTRTTPTTPATSALLQPNGTDDAATPAAIAGGQLRLARPEALPLRTDFPADPLRALLSAPGPLAAGEEVVVQVLARPAVGLRATRARRTGTGPAGAGAAGVARVPAQLVSTVLAGVLDLLTAPTTPPRTRRHHAVAGGAASGRPGGTVAQQRLADQARDRAIVAKQTGVLYETLVRYATTSQTADGAQAAARARERLRGRAHAIASAFELFAGHNRYRRHRLHQPGRAINRRLLGRGDLLSVPELAAIAHLPTDETIAGLERAGANSVVPPPGIPTSGAQVKPIGDADVGPARPVGLAVADARQHVHVIGATGSGKSELLAQMILADADAGRGLVTIDPKGDLIADLLGRLPTHVADRVVLFDAGSRQPPPCLNPLDTTNSDPARVTENLVSIFSRVYSDSWGPRTDDILRASLFTLIAQPATASTATLLDLPRLLADERFRREAAAAVTDPVLAGFWDWYDQVSEAARAAVIAPLMNKLRGFLLRPFVRHAIAAGGSTVDLADVLDNGGICLVRIPAGILGAQTTNLVGSLLVAHTWQAATARADRPQRQRADAGLYIDEAHNFLHLPYAIEDLLAQARGYRLSLTLAHQNLAQLSRELADGLATNARTKIFFATGPDDAARLARHTGPQLSEHDLGHLGAFQAAVRPVVGNRVMPAFTVVSRKLPPAVPGRARHIRATALTNTQPRAVTGTTPATDGSGRRSQVDPRRSADRPPPGPRDTRGYGS